MRAPSGSSGVLGAQLKRTNNVFRHFIVAALVATAIAAPVSASAQVACQAVFRAHLGLHSPFIQKWLKWEIMPTVAGWDQERPASPLPIARVSRESVTLEAASPRLEGLEQFQDLANSELPWFQHPYNQDMNVPNSSLAPVSNGVAYHTASRTVVTEIGGHLFALKMPTDHPFGPTKAHQPGKTKMDADLKYSVARTQAIEQIDRIIGRDDSIIVQKELLAVVDQKTKNGFLIRDLSQMDDGHYYLPAHMIPYVGKEIAAKNGSDVATFWSIHWAKALGRYQAKLLYRYGMRVRAVNPQNFLIQLDENMKPTGVLVWRDLAESHLIEPIAKRIGLNEFIKRDKENGGWGVVQDGTIDGTNMSWRFNDTIRTLDAAAQKDWEKTHENAYREELESALGVSIPEGKLQQWLNQELKAGDGSELIEQITEWHRDPKSIRRTPKPEPEKKSRWLNFFRSAG